MPGSLCCVCRLMLTARVMDSELKHGSGDEVSSKTVNQFYEQAIPANSVARAIAFAIEQPADVGINETELRPLTQEF